MALLLGATRPDRSPPLLGAGLLGGRDALVAVTPDQAQGAAYLERSTVLRLADGRLRWLPPGARDPVT
ncbi:MAG TPA: glycoside hydrolase family 15, partial [Actinomycetota bacterium]|nr:glycoside hydrolase family 15 [Actinomycetota bacterium]